MEDDSGHSFAEIYDEICTRVFGEDEEAADLTEYDEVDTKGMLGKVWKQAEGARVSTVESDNLSQPNVETTETLRKDGARAFRERDYMRAVRNYSALIEICSIGGDEKRESLQQAFANRSAVLQRCGMFQFCLGDIEMALDLSDEPKKEYLLLDRRGKCLAASGRKEEAREAYSEAMAASDLNKNLASKIKEVFRAQVKLEMERLEAKTGSEFDQEEESHLDKLTREALASSSKQFSSLSSCAKPTFSEEGRGRVLKTTREVKAGEVIAVERPVVSFTHCTAASEGILGGRSQPEVVSKACHHCLESLSSLVYYPSSVVPGIRFCSTKCYKEAFRSYHRYEAHILSDYLSQLKERRQVGMETSGCLFLAFRSVVSTPWRLLADDAACAPDPAFGSRNADEVLEGDSASEWRFLCSLMGHEDSSNISERLKIAIRAATLVKCLVNAGYFSEADRSAELTMLRRVYDAQFRIAHNVHTVYAPAGEVSGDIPLAVVGSAVYRSAVLVNHSCCQNTSKYYLPNGRLVMVAKRSLGQGEEITNNYGPHHSHMGRRDRRARLRHDFKFDCSCQACVEDFPLMKELISRPAVVKKSTAKQMDKILACYRRSFSGGDMAGATGACVEYLRKLDHAVATGAIGFPHKIFGVGEIALDSCWWGMVAQDMKRKNGVLPLK